MTAPDPRRRAEIQSALLRWYARHKRDLPWRDCGDPYRILVSETMLQQTQVDRVAPKYLAFLAQFPTLRDLAAAPVGDVIRAWSGLGYNQRAVRLREAAVAAVERFGGELPRTVEELRSLPGIGPYTAAAIASFAFGAAVATVDTNIRRVLTRVFAGAEPADAPGPTRAIWTLAEAALPPDRAGDWNQALMDLGATICVARNPQHLLCPLRDHCRFVAQADQMAIEPAVSPTPKLGRVAEAPSPYLATPTRSSANAEPFVGSSRYYRGRIVERLRAAPPGQVVTLAAIGYAVKPDYGTADAAWLQTHLERLARDGLVVVEADETGAVTARLP